MKRHALDPVSVVFGLLFAVLGLYFVNGERSVVDIGPALAWAVAVVAVGLLILLYAVKRITRTRRAEEKTNEAGQDS